MVSAIECRGDEVETAIAMPNFWEQAAQFEQYVVLHAVENRISRGLLMLSSSKAYTWVLEIADDAIERPGKSSWCDRLASDVSAQWTIAYANSTSAQITFDSKDYLPDLIPSQQATITLGRFTFDKERQNRHKIRAVTCVIEQWLQFPSNPQHKVRSALVSILIQHIPLSVLLLDDVWSMFRNPYQVVIHGKQGQRISSPHTEEVLELFNKALNRHPLTNKRSNEYLLLMVLSEEVDKWFQLVTAKTRVHRTSALSKKMVC